MVPVFVHLVLDGLGGRDCDEFAVTCENGYCGLYQMSTAPGKWDELVSNWR